MDMTLKACDYSETHPPNSLQTGCSRVLSGLGLEAFKCGNSCRSREILSQLWASHTVLAAEQYQNWDVR